MNSLPWIKLYTELLDDPNFHRLTESQKWRFVQLLLLAGTLDAEGYLSSSGLPWSPDWMAWRLRCDLAELQVDLQALAGADLIELDEAQASWLIPSFANRQERPDDDQRRRWRETKRLQRLRRSAQPVPSGSPGPGYAEQEDEVPDLTPADRASALISRCYPRIRLFPFSALSVYLFKSVFFRVHP
jgi:hypothetical protein